MERLAEPDGFQPVIAGEHLETSDRGLRIGISLQDPISESEHSFAVKQLQDGIFKLQSSRASPQPFMITNPFASINIPHSFA